MTSLSVDADDFVRAFATAFEDFMAQWAEAIQCHPDWKRRRLGTAPCLPPCP